MNLGYQIDHFNKLAAEGNEGRAILNTAKYGQRIADLAMNPANGIVLSDRSTKTLQLARESFPKSKKMMSTSLPPLRRNRKRCADGTMLSLKPHRLISSGKRTKK
jgi:hypothetical protein